MQKIVMSLYALDLLGELKIFMFWEAETILCLN